MTNDARMNRGLTDTALCPLCGLEDQMLMHLFRNCEVVKDTWWLISKGIVPALFFQEDGMRWLEINLEDEFPIDGLGWNIWFGLTMLSIWQRRNEKAFQNTNISSIELFHRIRCLATGVRSTLENDGSSRIILSHQYGRQTKREAPLDGWVKLNCDAAVTNLGTSAAVGGVLLNADGNFLLGYAMDVGEATVTVVELKAILIGLKLLRGKGYSKVVINSNSFTAV